MAIIVIQIGQCGNQVGERFYNTILNELIENPKSYPPNSPGARSFVDTITERFFTENKKGLLEAKAVLVDTEQKVIESDLKKAVGDWCYDRKQIVAEKRGAGNNWAHGYVTHGPKLRERVLECIDRQLEKTDTVDGFLILMSVAGGTGSGVGAYVTQILRECYPHSSIINQVIWPYDSGDVIVQNYNAVLSLSRLLNASDAIIITENKKLHDISSKLLHVDKVTFNDLNDVLSAQLANLLLPAHQRERADGWTYPIRHPLSDMLEHMVCHPQYKLLTMTDIPHVWNKARSFNVYQWDSLLKNLRQMSVSDWHMEEGINWNIKVDKHFKFNRSIANLLVARGEDAHNADTSSLSDPLLYTPSANNVQLGLLEWGNVRPMLHAPKSALLLSNCQSVVPTLNQVTNRAWEMFGARAYIHEYAKEGVLEEDFVDSFATIEQLCTHYSNLR